MPRLRIPELTEFERADLSGLPRQELEDLAWRFRELARTLANRLGEDSTTSSRPPSSDDPYRRDQRGGPGPVGQGRDGGADQDAATPGREAETRPQAAGAGVAAAGGWACRGAGGAADRGEPGNRHVPVGAPGGQAALGAERRSRQVSVHHVDLEPGAMGLQVIATRHRYFAASRVCGHATVASPGVGLHARSEGRSATCN